VGDGSQINILEDHWIPGSHNLKVLTPRESNLLSKIEDLIDPTTGNWDENLVKGLFWEVDANRILHIPLVQGREDVVAWHHTQNGYFSVGSAYHVQWLHKFRASNAHQQAGGTGEEQVWSKLWNLNIPAKIKIFGWKVLHGLIPCRGILANRHIENISSCPACHEGCEDIKHLLFGCNQASTIWRILGVSEEIQKAMRADRSGSGVVVEIIKSST